MHHPDQPDGNTGVNYPGPLTPGASLVEQARQSVKRLDIAECTRIVAWAIEHPSIQSTSALGILTAKPTRGRARRSWHRQRWVNMRLSAIDALINTHSSLAAPALIQSVMCETGRAREIAKSALVEMGARAVPALMQCVKNSSDWPLDGMLDIIAILAIPKHPSLYKYLYWILTGYLPVMSERWLRYTICWSVSLGVTITLGVVLGAVLNVLPGALMAAFISSVVCAVCAGVVIKHLRTQEAMKLKAAAANAIIKIKNPGYVPTLLDIAMGKFSFWSKYEASRALIELLPEANIKTCRKLDAAHEQKLTGLLGEQNADLILAVVRSLEYLGSGQSADALERFTRRRSEPGVSDKALVEAERVLPMLQERRRQEQAPSTLLRPSQPGEDNGDGLLRPLLAPADAELQSDELLRPDR